MQRFPIGKYLGSIIIPHFGAGLLREALMVADLCPNVLLDTSSSNGWIRYVGMSASPPCSARRSRSSVPDRLLFGSDSSFFSARLGRERVRAAVRRARRDRRERGRARHDLGANFDRLFGARAGGA